VEAHDAGGRGVHRRQLVPAFLQPRRTQRIRVSAWAWAVESAPTVG
jgi:hypothetical protein